MDHLDKQGEAVTEARKEREIAQSCLHAAGAVGRWRVLASRSTPPVADGDFEAELSWSGGRAKFACVVMPHLSRQTIPVAVHRADRVRAAHMSALVLTRHVTPQLGRLLRDHGVQFLDMAGNGYLDGQGLFVWAVGNPAPAASPRRPRVFKTSGLKLVFVLLSSRDALNWSQRELARAAGIALGGVGAVLRDLMDMGYIARVGPEARALARTGFLIHRWDSGYLETLRPALHVGRYRIRSSTELESWAQGAAPILHGAGGLLGGETGAALLIQSFRPASAVVHVGADHVPAMVRELGLLPDPGGSVTLLTTFGGRNGWGETRHGVPLADPLLLRAELLAESDDRLAPTISALLEEYIQRRLPGDPRT